VKLPSDLQGVKVMNAGAIGYRTPEARGDEYRTPELPIHLVRELDLWLEGLPNLAERIPPIVQLHGYSGRWSIETTFEIYRGMHITPPDEVHWFGFTSLFIPPSGRGGKGIMYGSHHVTWAGYRSQHDLLNDVRDATVDPQGVLTLRVLILRRQLIHEEGSLPEEQLRGDLPAKEFDIELKPVAGQPRELRGIHQYTRGTESYQAAVERYRRTD
jgi:hypothetical protein